MNNIKKYNELVSESIFFDSDQLEFIKELSHGTVENLVEISNILEYEIKNREERDGNSENADKIKLHKRVVDGTIKILKIYQNSK